MARGEKIIGIDLGTTQSVLARVDLESEAQRVELLPVPQLLAAATVAYVLLAIPLFIFAGELMNITGVTQRIRSLERELGVTLFVRSRKGMRATAEGEALVLAVRPEHIRLTAGEGPGGPATLGDVAFQGDSSIVEVTLADGRSVQVLEDAAGTFTPPKWW